MPLNHTDVEFSYKDVLLMPLRGTILLTTLGLAVLYSLGSAGGLLGLWMRIITVIAAIRYAQIVVEKLAYGHREPPPLSPQDFNIFYDFGAMGFYAVLVVFLLLGNLIGTHLGSGIAFAYSALVVFASPAIFAATVLENTITTAFNPVRIGKIIAAIGWRYVGVFAIVVFGYMASALLADLIGFQIVTAVAGLYGIFLLSCAVGRLIFVSRNELGLNITSPQELIQKQNAEIERGHDMGALQIAHQTARLAPKEAAAELWRYHEQANTPALRQLACFAALQEWPDATTALHFSQPFIRSLFATGRNDDAIDVVRWCLTQESQFRLADAETTYGLGMFAISAGQFKLAAGIMQDIGKRHPDYQNSISGLFKVGTIAAERLNHVPLLRSAITQLLNLGISREDSRLNTLEQQLKELEKPGPGS